MLDKIQYLINSSDRVRGSSTADFVVKPNPTLRGVVNTHIRMTAIQNGLVNVDENNNTFLWNGDAVSLPIGYYDQNSLSSALGDLLTTNPFSSQVVVDILANQKVRIRANAGFTISFAGYIGAASLLGYATTTYVVSTTTAGSYQITSPFNISLNTYDYILVQSNKLGSRIRTSTGLNAFAMLLNYNNGSTNSIIYENYMVMDPIYNSRPADFEEIDIRLVDNTGKVLNLRNQSVSILLELFAEV